MAEEIRFKFRQSWKNRLWFRHVNRILHWFSRRLTRGNAGTGQVYAARRGLPESATPSGGVLKWLSPPLTVRKVTGVFAILWVSIYAILIAANIRPAVTKEGPVRCAWQFPKLLSCLLGVRENLAGGLIGGGGALFAAWVAWSAVREQMTEARAIALRSETEALEIIKAEIDPFLHKFFFAWLMVNEMIPVWQYGTVETGDSIEVIGQWFPSEHHEQEWYRTFAAVRKVIMFMSTLNPIDRIQPAVEHLGPLHFTKVFNVIKSLKVYFAKLDNLKQSMADDQPRNLEKDAERLGEACSSFTNVYNMAIEAGLRRKWPDVPIDVILARQLGITREWEAAKEAAKANRRVDLGDDEENEGYEDEENEEDGSSQRS